MAGRKSPGPLRTTPLRTGVSSALTGTTWSLGDFREGELLAVNHGGDSDSTGSIAGNLLGLVHGKSGIPADWLEHLELRDVIERVGNDLWAHFGREESKPCRDQGDYPPW